MRTSILLLTAALLSTGCSTKTALDAFHVDSQTERALNSLKTATAVEPSGTKAVITSIYLNEVYPERYSGDEYFIIGLYRQDAEAGFTLLLNETVAPANLDELAHEDPLCRLMPVYNKWNRYYLVRFPEQSSEDLTLTLGNGLSATGALSYRKDGQ
ncbi:MAG: hypothetical protein R3302_02890 [Sulfurimonadaceae bacterium]|nr:hypothetical protein [Sulfurimonadaceae bacterium]